jgi:hypothetical protein
MGVSLDTIETITKILAFVGASLFFGFKVFSGFFLFNLSVALKCERKSKPTTEVDVMVVTATLKKGDMSALVLHDIRAKVSFDDKAQIIPFSGFLRSSYETDTSLGFERKVALMDRTSESSPFLNFVPGEESSFSCVTEVPRAAIVRVDLVVLGKRALIGRRVGQWRSTAIVPPGVSAIPSVNRMA